MTSSAVVRKTSFGGRETLFVGRRTSFEGAAAIRPAGNDPQEIAESLLALAGVGVLGYVRALVEMFRSEGYTEAAARWDAISTIMGSIMTEEPAGEGPDLPSVSHLPSSPMSA
jgi:hypothetical protein